MSFKLSKIFVLVLVRVYLADTNVGMNKRILSPTAPSRVTGY